MASLTSKVGLNFNQNTFYLPEALELFCASAQPWHWLWLEAKCRSNPTTGLRLRPPRPPCVAMITASIIPELRLFTCAPPPFSREDKPPDKGIQKCQKLRHPFFRNCVTLLQNCIIHHISVKNASFIQHHMRRIGFMRNSWTWSPFKLWRIWWINLPFSV